MCALSAACLCRKILSSCSYGDQDGSGSVASARSVPFSPCQELPAPPGWGIALTKLCPFSASHKLDNRTALIAVRRSEVVRRIPA